MNRCSWKLSPRKLTILSSKQHINYIQPVDLLGSYSFENRLKNVVQNCQNHRLSI